MAAAGMDLIEGSIIGAERLMGQVMAGQMLAAPRSQCRRLHAGFRSAAKANPSRCLGDIPCECNWDALLGALPKSNLGMILARPRPTPSDLHQANRVL